MERNQSKLMNFLLGVRHHKFVNSLVCFLKSPLVLFSIVLLVSAYCKLLALNSRELWLDETYSAFVANLPFGELSRHLAGEYNPPLYYLFLWGWVRVVGDTQAQLRLFSVVINICSIPGMYVMARRTLGTRSSAFAAALFALSPMLFVYSMVVRNYTLFIFFLVCLLIVHWAVAVEQREEKWLVCAYAILAALLFYINYLGIFILLGLCVHWVIVSGFVRNRIVRLCATGILIILFTAPGIPSLLERNSLKSNLHQALVLSHQDPRALSFGIPTQEANEASGAGIGDAVKSVAAAAGFYPSSSSLVLLLCAVPLAVALAGVGFLGLVAGDEVCRLFVVLLIAVGIGLASLHLYATRYMLPLVPLLVLAIASTIRYGAAMPRWRRLSLAVGTLILCLYAAGFSRQAFMRHGRPWQNLVSIVQQKYRPGDQVIFDVLYSQVPFDYFARHAHFKPQESGFPFSIYDWWDKQSNKAWGGPVILQSDLDQFISGLSASKSKTLWLVLYETYYYDPHNALLARLRQLGQVTEVSLPPDRDTTSSQEALRLIRITIH